MAGEASKTDTLPLAALGEAWKSNLFHLIDGLMAYDHGATDSGMNDPELKLALKKYLKSLSDFDLRLLTATYARQYYLSDVAVSKGYGLEDVRRFIDWMAEELGIHT